MHKIREGGYVLLALLLVLFVAGTSFLFSVATQGRSINFEEDENILRELQSAKAELLYYAVNTPTLYGDLIGPGYLPCPDANNDGRPDTNPLDICPPGVTVGRLPQRIPLPDGSEFQLSAGMQNRDDQFWYAVSSRHLRTSANTPASAKLNASMSRLRLDEQENIVAIVFAPGPVVPGQSRTPTTSEVLSISNYLDGNENTDGDSTYTLLEYTPADDAQSFNDRVITITHNELMLQLGMSESTRIKAALDNNYIANGSSYPQCHPTWGCSLVEATFINSINTGWITSESWHERFGPFTLGGTSYYWHTQPQYTVTAPGGEPRISFSGCAGISYTFAFGADVTRTGSSCL